MIWMESGRPLLVVPAGRTTEGQAHGAGQVQPAGLLVVAALLAVDPDLALRRGDAGLVGDGSGRCGRGDEDVVLGEVAGPRGAEPATATDDASIAPVSPCTQYVTWHIRLGSNTTATVTQLASCGPIAGGPEQERRAAAETSTEPDAVRMRAAW